MEGVSLWTLLSGVPLVLLGATGLIGTYLQKTPAIVGIITSNIGQIGIVLMFPPLIRPLSQLAMKLMRPLLRTEAQLAQRQILRHPSRTMLTMGVLFVSISAAIALATSVMDNVKNVRDWYRQTIVADFFIWKMMPGMDDSLGANVPPDIGPEIHRLPGVVGVDTLRWHNVNNLEGQQAIVVIRDFPSVDFVNFDTRGKDAAELYRRLHAGEAIVGSPLAQKLGKRAGDDLIFSTRSGGKRAVRIAAINNEYRAGGLLLNMQRKTAEEILNVEGIDEYIIKADPKRRAEVEEALAAICVRHGISVHSLAEIINMIDGMVNGLVVGLWGVMILGFVVTALGVVNTLTMNVLEQTRELGLLRVVGMTRWQVRRMIISQGLLLGSLALIPGMLCGLGVAWVINVATLPATGHAIEMGIYPGMIGGVLVLAILTAAVAAFLPAERAARMPPSSCLQYE
jgi:putative ABC transport system permease protein